MNASERLRELATENVTDSFDAIYDLHRALPEIVAVVEAAEHLHERVEMDESVGICLSSRAESLTTGAALAALEEKLGRT